MIPGGLGSFDLVFIWGSEYLGIQNEKVVVLLLLYRIGYFFIPFLVGAFFFFKVYWEKWNKNWGNLPNVFIQRISHWVLTILIFISGLILLLSAALPGIIERLKMTEDILSLSDHQFISSAFRCHWLYSPWIIKGNSIQSKACLLSNDCSTILSCVIFSFQRI